MPNRLDPQSVETRAYGNLCQWFATEIMHGQSSPAFAAVGSVPVKSGGVSHSRPFAKRFYLLVFSVFLLVAVGVFQSSAFSVSPVYNGVVPTSYYVVFDDPAFPSMAPPSYAAGTASGGAIELIPNKPYSCFPCTVPPPGTAVGTVAAVATPSVVNPLDLEINAQRTYALPSPSPQTPNAQGAGSVVSNPSAAVKSTINVPRAAASAMTKAAVIDAVASKAAGKAVLSAAARFALSPAGFVAITAGQLLFDALKNDGVVFNDDGSLNKSQITSPLCESWALSNYKTNFVNPAYEYRGYKVAGSSCYLIWSYTQASIGGSVPFSDVFLLIGGTLLPSDVNLNGSVPLTQSALELELDKVINADITNARLASGVNFALENGQPLPKGLSIVSSPTSVSLSSAPSLSSSTVTAGNTTNTFTQKTAVITPSSKTGSPTQIIPADKNSTVVNGAPTTTVTTPTPISIPSSSGGGSVAPPKDLCVDHPDILACNVDVDGDVPDDKQLIKKDINLTFSPVSFGGAAYCPAPYPVGFGKVIDFSSFCGFLSMLHPIMLLFAWLAAARIVLAPIKL